MKKFTCLLLLALSICGVSKAQTLQQKAFLRDSKQVLTALQKNDLKTVARFVGPRKLRFSAQIYAQKRDLTFSKSRLPFLAFSPKKWSFGSYDGSGEEIKLTWANYARQYVWDRNYSKAPFVGVGFTKSRGNAINNLREFYRGATLVEYHFPSKSEDVMDWSSLWLVWQKSGAKWHLTGIAHDEWST
ncbi:MAG TPA: hypothetical protein VGB45_01750 [Abditibacterium sp.]|jgi:hypothetical protein